MCGNAKIYQELAMVVGSFSIIDTKLILGYLSLYRHYSRVFFDMATGYWTRFFLIFFAVDSVSTFSILSESNIIGLFPLEASVILPLFLVSFLPSGLDLAHAIANSSSLPFFRVWVNACANLC